MSFEMALKLRQSDPKRYESESFRTMIDHCKAMLALQARGADTFDYGNNLRGFAREAGFADAFGFEGSCRSTSARSSAKGKGPFRWVALSGDPKDIATTDRIIQQLFPRDTALMRWIQLAGERVKFQGLPARICWLGYGDRAKAGARSTTR
jgi:urocanate hydratase